MGILNILSVLLIALGIFLLPALLFYFSWRKFFSLVESIGLVICLEIILFSLLVFASGYSQAKLLVALIIFSALMVLSRFFIGRGKVPWRKISKLKTKVLLIIIIFLVFLSLPLVARVPFDVDAQGFGQMALSIREGGTLENLAPYYPEIKWVYSPGFLIFTAFISDLGNLSLHIVMLVLTVVILVMVFIFAFLFGRRVKNELFGFIFAGLMLLGTWLATAYLDSHFTTLLGVFCILSFLYYFFGCIERLSFKNMFGAVVSLAAMAYAHPDAIFNLLIGFIPFYFFIFLSRQRKKITQYKYFVLFFALPLMALLIFLPHLVHTLNIMRGSTFVHTGFLVRPKHFLTIFLFGGVVVPFLALAGLYYAFKKRALVDMLMLPWFFTVIEFSAIGILIRLSSLFPVDLLSWAYPFGIAWHAPIIPYVYLASLPLYNLIIFLNKRGSAPWVFFKKRFNLICLVLIFVLLALLPFGRHILLATKQWSLPLYGEFSSADDLKAMLWIRENTPQDAYVFNYPKMGGHFEGHWVPVVAERKCVSVREQPFWFGEEEVRILEKSLVSAYVDPVSKEAEKVIYEQGIDYIIVPQILENPESFDQMLRWRSPRAILELKSRFEHAAYLTLVYNSNGAKVFEVIEQK